MTPALLLSVWALLAPAEGPLVIVAVQPDRQPGCPAAGDVELALRSLLRQGTLVAHEAAGRTGRPDRLTLVLQPRGANASRLRLTDAQGNVRLERTLAVGEGEGAKDCTALAQTAAFIVERYLVELDYKPPPPPPPPAPPPLEPGRWELAGGGAWVPGRPGSSAWELGARVGRQLAGRRLVATLGARITGRRSPLPARTLYRGRATQRGLPVDLGLWWRTTRWGTDLRAGLGGALELTRTWSEGDPGDEKTRLLAGPALWVGSAAQRGFLRRGFVRLSAVAAGSLLQYDFSYRLPGSDTDVTAFTTPPDRFYARLSFELGFVLP